MSMKEKLDNITAKDLDNIRKLPLTQLEFEVFEYAIQGKSLKYVMKKASLTFKTIVRIIGKVFDKYEKENKQ